MISYDEFAKRYHALVGTPLALAFMGDFSRAGELHVLSQEAVGDYHSNLQALALEIEAFDASGLPLDQQLDLEMAVKALQGERYGNTVDVNGHLRYSVAPEAATKVVALTPSFLGNDPRSPPEILDDAILRMQKVGGHLQEHAATLADVLLLPAAQTEQRMASALPIVGGFFLEFAKSHDYSRVADLEGALDQVSEAAGSYAQVIGAKETTTQVSVGEEATRRLFQLRGIDVTLEEMYRLCKEHLGRITKGVEELKERLIEKYSLDRQSTIFQVRDFLRGRFALNPSEYVSTMEEMVERSRTFAYDHIVHPLSTELDLRIGAVPDHLSAFIPQAGVLRPGSLATGIPRVQCYVNLKAPYGQINRLSMLTLASHEGFPGHTYQLVERLKHPSPFRAWNSPTDLTEGWATYVGEELMLGADFMEEEGLADEERFSRTLSFLGVVVSSAMNLCLLTGNTDYLDISDNFQSQGSDPWESSIAFYQTMLNSSPKQAQGKAASIVLRPTYSATYLVGNRLMRELHSNAQANQGRSFSEKDFWRSVSSKGHMPLSYIARELEHDGII